MPGAASEPGLRGGPLEINGERVKIFRCMNFFHKTNVCMIFLFFGGGGAQVLHHFLNCEQSLIFLCKVTTRKT